MNGINLKTTGDLEASRTSRKDEVKRSTEGVAQQQPVANQQSPAVADKINVSDRGAAVGKLVDKISELPDARAAKVEALRQKLNAGEYKPSSKDIANAILKDET